MNRNVLFVIGAFFLILFSMTGLIIVPQRLSLEAEKDEIYVPLEVKEGHKVYVAEGCVYCHSQQVRPDGFGSDIDRGWGKPSIPEDYKNLTPHVLGTMRTGPDLAAIGVRQPSWDWQMIHLYNPRAVSPGSIMPAYTWLFEIVDQDARPNQKGLALPGEYAIPGKKVIPTKKAEDLVAYLLSLKQERNEE